MIEVWPVWCCEYRHKCKWQAFALTQGLGWGVIPKGTEWRKWHDNECGGGLIQGFIHVSDTDKVLKE